MSGQVKLPARGGGRRRDKGGQTSIQQRQFISGNGVLCSGTVAQNDMHSACCLMSIHADIKWLVVLMLTFEQACTVTGTHRDSQRLTEAHRGSQARSAEQACRVTDSQGLTGTHRDSQGLAEPHRGSQSLTEAHRGSHCLTGAHRGSQMLTSTHGLAD